MFFVDAPESLHHSLQKCVVQFFLLHPGRVKRAREKSFPGRKTLLQKLGKTFNYLSARVMFRQPPIKR
jgi:hypothetical protein